MHSALQAKPSLALLSSMPGRCGRPEIQARPGKHEVALEAASSNQTGVYLPGSGFRCPRDAGIKWAWDPWRLEVTQPVRNEFQCELTDLRFQCPSINVLCSLLVLGTPLQVG